MELFQQNIGTDMGFRFGESIFAYFIFIFLCVLKYSYLEKLINYHKYMY
jgi:hypothetical protein